jgi:hypothetical protein
LEGRGSHGPLNNFVVIVIIIYFLVAPDFVRLECFKVVSVDTHSPIPFLRLDGNWN